MKRTAQIIAVIAIPLLGVAVGTAGCGSGRATSDASTIGKGGSSGSAGSAGLGGRGGGSGGGAGGAAGNAGTGGGGTGGASGMGGGGTGGGGTGSGDAGTIPCGNTVACAADQICVRTVVGGATYICPDGGGFNPTLTCPANATLDENGCCFGAESRSYRCAARPSSCGATVTCACASTLCTFGACSDRLGANEIACLSAGT